MTDEKEDIEATLGSMVDDKEIALKENPPAVVEVKVNELPQEEKHILYQQCECKHIVDPAIWDSIIYRLACGEGLMGICRDEGYPNFQSVYVHIERCDVFRNRYSTARRVQVEIWADKIVEIAQDRSKDIQTVEKYDKNTGELIAKEQRSDNTAVNRDRLQVETLLKLMERLMPEKYGQRIEHGGTIQVTPVLNYKNKQDANKGPVVQVGHPRALTPRERKNIQKKEE